MSSPRMAKLSWAAEVFYRRLHSVVDDFGRYFAHPMLLRAACYPLQLDKVSDSDIGKWLGETQKAALVRVYESSGQQYLEVKDFKQKVRLKQGSKYPEPDPQMQCACIADDQHPPDTSTADAGLGVVVVEGVGGAGKRRKPPPETPIPDDFAISDRVRRWAVEHEVHNLAAHFESFVSKARAKGYKYVDWDEGFMGAIRKDWAGIGKGKPDGKKQVAI